MNFDNQSSNPSYSSNETTLIDVYLTIKRNSKLFFFIVSISFLISLIIAYIQYDSSIKKENTSDSFDKTLEYVVWIEIGRVYGVNANSSLIDSAQNTLEKINTIYIPSVESEFASSENKLVKKQVLSVTWSGNTDLLAIRANSVTSDIVDYKKLLLSIASLVLDDHNNTGISKSGFLVKPTKIISGPTKHIIEEVNNNNNNNKLIYLPVLGFVLGLILAFIIIFLIEFKNKIKLLEGK